jgi:hypothetical protein
MGIMNLRLATIAPWGREIVLPASVLVFVAIGAAKVEHTGAAPIVSRIAPALTADLKSADRPQHIVADKPAMAIDRDFVATANALAAMSAADSRPGSPDPLLRVASADPTASIAPEPAPAAHEPEPQPIVTAALTDPSETLSPELDAKVTASSPGVDARQIVGSTEILDECFVIDACADRYLWALYQRTPKEDSVKEKTQKEVTVKRKGKMVTVTRTVTQVVDEDFGWKDPKAAEHAGMPMTDYVIGGMDRDFKLRLFRLLLAAEQAGLSPGITSAFRDDYRQSIASGLKAADNRSYHGGSLRGGYGRGLAADIVSVNGATRALRQASSETLWNWVDKHGKNYGIGRPYHDHDPPHVGPIDGSEYVSRHGASGARHARATSKPRHAAVGRADQSAAQRVRTANAAAR